MSWSHPLSSLASLVRDRIDQWQSHGQPSAAAVLAEHPELRDARSLVLDLALAEYSLRKEAGQTVAKSEFCDQFPDYRQSLAHLLAVQDYLDRCPAYTAAADTPRWPIPGETFWGYEIVEPLGRGGLARVFLAREPAVGSRHVVIKVSPHSDHEAHTLGKLAHPGIVPIHSVLHDPEGDWTIICMPLVGAATGIDLLDAAFSRPGAIRDAALVARVAQETRPLTAAPVPAAETRPFPWFFTYSDAISKLGLDIAEALEAAHAAGVLHRDIKPSNILLSWSGRAMLLDFNLSTQGDLAPQRIGGTLAYMAPEIIESLLNDQGQAARRFDPRCDVYSFGVVLFELLTGHLPFQPADAERLVGDAYQPWLEAKRQLAADIGRSAEFDAGLVEIVRRCLAFDPAERYADAACLAAAIRRHLSGAALARRVAKRKRRELVLVLVALAAAIGGIFAYAGSRPSELDTLYQQAIAHYDAGDFAKAAATFTRCLELRAGWPQALFGRAQSLRRQNKWKDARTDYIALAEIEPGLSYALAGFCNIQVNDAQSAFFDFQRAYEKGLRDSDFLLNFAAVSKRRIRYADAVRLYSDVLSVNPNHRVALRERALTQVALVINQPNRQIDSEALNDARRYHELDSSFDGAYVAARVFGEAARKDKKHEEDAIRYLTIAIEKGLPKRLLMSLPPDSKWLVPKLPQDLISTADAGNKTATLRQAQIVEPPLNADWYDFLKGRARQQFLAGSE